MEENNDTTSVRVESNDNISSDNDDNEEVEFTTIDDQSQIEKRVATLAAKALQEQEYIIVPDNNSKQKIHPNNNDNNKKNNNKSNYWSLPLRGGEQRPMMAARITQLNVTVTMHSTRPGSTGGDAVGVRVTLPLLAFESFPMPLPSMYAQPTPRWRLRATLLALRVDDAVHSSSYRHMLTSAGDDITTSIELLTHTALLPAQTFWSCRAKVQPLRLYVNSDTVEFLVSFVPDTPPPTNDNNNNNDDNNADEEEELGDFIDFIDIEPLDIVADYKPQSNLLQPLYKTGQFMYLAKLIPIEELKLHLRRLRARDLPTANLGEFGLFVF